MIKVALANVRLDTINFNSWNSWKSTIKCNFKLTIKCYFGFSPRSVGTDSYVSCCWLSASSHQLCTELNISSLLTELKDLVSKHCTMLYLGKSCKTRLAELVRKGSIPLKKSGILWNFFTNGGEGSTGFHISYSELHMYQKYGKISE